MGTRQALINYRSASEEGIPTGIWVREEFFRDLDRFCIDSSSRRKLVLYGIGGLFSDELRSADCKTIQVGDEFLDTSQESLSLLIGSLDSLLH
jgi:hypothetical protein